MKPENGSEKRPEVLSRDRKGETAKNLCDRDFAELSGRFSGAICLKTLVLLGSGLELFRNFFGAVRAIFGFVSLFWALIFQGRLSLSTVSSSDRFQVWPGSKGPSDFSIALQTRLGDALRLSAGTVDLSDWLGMAWNKGPSILSNRTQRHPETTRRKSTKMLHWLLGSWKAHEKRSHKISDNPLDGRVSLAVSRQKCPFLSVLSIANNRKSLGQQLVDPYLSRRVSQGHPAGVRGFLLSLRAFLFPELLVQLSGEVQFRCKTSWPGHACRHTLWKTIHAWHRGEIYLNLQVSGVARANQRKGQNEKFMNFTFFVNSGVFP